MEVGHLDSVKKFENERVDRSPKILLWVSMVSICMLFAGLTSAYVVRQSEANWKPFEIPVEFLISTILIVLSSLTIQLSLKAIRKNDLSITKTLLIVTLGLGIGFVFCQFLGWAALVEQNVHFVDKKTPSGSFFYVLTGMHVAHIIGGIIYLLIIIAKALLNKYDSSKHLGIELCSIYWHFLDVLWLYLYAFLWFIR